MKTTTTFLFLLLSATLSFGSLRRIEISKATQAESQIKFSVTITPDKQLDGHCLVELVLPAGQQELTELWKVFLWVLQDKKTILAAPLDLSYAKDKTITVRFHGHVDTVSQCLIAIRCGQLAPRSETIYQIDVGSYLIQGQESAKATESAKMPQKPQKQTGTVFTEYELVSMGFKKTDLSPHYQPPVFVKKAIPLGDLARELQFDLTSMRATDQASGPDDVYHVLIPTGICYVGYVSDPKASDRSNPKTLVNATVLQVPLRPFTDEKDPNKANALRPPLTDKQIEAVSPVIKDLAAALQLLGDRFPEMKSLDAKKIVATTGTSVGVAFSHSFKGLREKRAIRPEDFGTHGIEFGFACRRPMLLDGGVIHASSGEPPMMKLQNLGLEVYYGVLVGPNSSDGVRDEVMKILKKHAELLAEIDKGLSQSAARTNSVSTGALPEQKPFESLPTTLSPKARSFIESVEKHPSGFYFSVSYLKQTGLAHGIVFRMKAAHGDDNDSIVIDKNEAIAMTRYFANNDMLERTDVHPPGVTPPGWSVSLGTEKVEAYWHLGREKNALLKSQEVMGAKTVLKGKALKAWDEWIENLKKGKAANVDRAETRDAGQTPTGFRRIDTFSEGGARLVIGQTKAEIRQQLSLGRMERHRKMYTFRPPESDMFEQNVWLLVYGPEVPGMGTVTTIRVTFKDGNVSKLEKRTSVCP